MINAQQKSQLKNIMQSRQWEVVEEVARQYVVKLQSNERIKSTEWETIRDNCRIQGQLEGINNFLQELTKQAND